MDFGPAKSGRPIIVHDHDIGIARPPLEVGYKFQVIAMWLRLGDLLGEVINLYRPPVERNMTEWGDEFPTFSDFTRGIDVLALEESHRSKQITCTTSTSANVLRRPVGNLLSSSGDFG